MRYATFGLLAVTLVACGCNSTTAPDSPQLSVTTNATFYRPGDTLTLRVSNIGSTTLYFGACTHLQVFRGTWVASPHWPTVCALPLGIVAPESTNTWSYPLSDSLDTGTYRAIADVFIGSDASAQVTPDQRTTTPFRIAP